MIGIIGGSGVLECIAAKIKLENKEYDVWLGFSDNFKISGASILLNGKMEG